MASYNRAAKPKLGKTTVVLKLHRHKLIDRKLIKQCLSLVQGCEMAVETYVLKAGLFCVGSTTQDKPTSLVSIGVPCRSFRSRSC